MNIILLIQRCDPLPAPTVTVECGVDADCAGDDTCCPDKFVCEASTGGACGKRYPAFIQTCLALYVNHPVRVRQAMITCLPAQSRLNRTRTTDDAPPLRLEHN